MNVEGILFALGIAVGRWSGRPLRDNKQLVMLMAFAGGIAVPVLGHLVGLPDGIERLSTFLGGALIGFGTGILDTPDEGYLARADEAAQEVVR